MKKKILSLLVAGAMIGALYMPVEAKTATLKASHFKSDQVTLSWNKFGKNYTIYRKTGKTYKKLTTTHSCSYTDHKLSDKVTYTYQVKSGNTKTNTVSNKYSHVSFAKEKTLWENGMSKDKKKLVSDFAARFINEKIKPGMSPIIKLEIAGKVVGDQASYEQNYKYATSYSYGPVKYHKADCGGYAALFKALCDAMKIGCWVVQPGFDESRELTAHIFNLVKYKGKWYAADAEGSFSFQSGGWLNKVNKKGKWIYKDTFAKVVKKYHLNVATNIRVQHIPHVTDYYNGNDDSYGSIYVDDETTQIGPSYEESLTPFNDYYRFMIGKNNTPFLKTLSKQKKQFDQANQLFVKKNAAVMAKFNEVLNLYKKVQKNGNGPLDHSVDVYFEVKKLNQMNHATRFTIYLNSPYDDLSITYNINGDIVKRVGNYDKIKNQIKKALHIDDDDNSNNVVDDYDDQPRNDSPTTPTYDSSDTYM